MSAAQSVGPQALPALQEQVEQILAEADGPCEVRIALPNGQTLCAQASAGQLTDQGLALGGAVRAQFAASHVLLGTQV